MQNDGEAHGTEVSRLPGSIGVGEDQVAADVVVVGMAKKASQAGSAIRRRFAR
jgi:hypothetical protein